jgi:hypothetical protein
VDDIKDKYGYLSELCLREIFEQVEDQGCPHCGGDGHIERPWGIQPCYRCGGKGTFARATNFSDSRKDTVFYFRPDECEVVFKHKFTIDLPHKSFPGGGRYCRLCGKHIKWLKSENSDSGGLNHADQWKVKLLYAFYKWLTIDKKEPISISATDYWAYCNEFIGRKDNKTNEEAANADHQTF